MDCYSCIYRRPVPGSTHSSCEHYDRISEGVITRKLLGVKLIRHGVMHGWARWPFDFDPVWIEACNGYTAKEALK